MYNSVLDPFSHTGPPDSSGPFSSRFCLSNTPPTADMSSWNHGDPNTPEKELNCDVLFLLIPLSPVVLHHKALKYSSSQTQSVHTCVCLLVCVCKKFIFRQSGLFRPVCRHLLPHLDSSSTAHGCLTHFISSDLITSASFHPMPYLFP